MHVKTRGKNNIIGKTSTLSSKKTKLLWGDVKWICNIEKINDVFYRKKEHYWQNFSFSSKKTKLLWHDGKWLCDIEKTNDAILAFYCAEPFEFSARKCCCRYKREKNYFLFNKFIIKCVSPSWCEDMKQPSFPLLQGRYKPLGGR